MSIKVSVYVPALGRDLLPKIAARFADLGMPCQFHPGFELDPAKDSGLISMRLQVPSSGVPKYENVDMLSGFEIAFKDFRYSAPLAVNPNTNQKLKVCTKVITVRMHAAPTSALRAGMYFAAILAELTDGIVYTPRSDRYLDGKQALEYAKEEVAAYETQLPPQDWNVVPFTAWT